MSHTNNNANRVAIIGASGYGGMQLIRLLSSHPKFQISLIAGHKTAGRQWNDISPFLKLNTDLEVQTPDPDAISNKADFAILSLPNGLSSQLTPELLSRNVRVIDLSADYRYRSLYQWKHVYKNESNEFDRNDDSLCKEAIYGIPEWNQQEIQTARLVSSPGCYPTASLLPLMPFLKQGLIENESIIIDAKSGTSGAGRSPKENLLLSESSESISPYAVLGHRHTSEIEQQASLVSGKSIELQFTPHLVPMVRGILSTIYSRLRDPGLTAEDCRTVLDAFYRNYNTVDILPVGMYPSTKWVRYTNKALISLQVDKRNGRLIILSAIDNLMKGQAGQAIQILNIMSGYNHDLGLPLTTYYP
ncbi:MULTISPECIES: N-acetyl-gamma-glutamyl-phosphate reductase [Prochlorococcus]|uniref:N-acetyl-gamma-glutamyl-phosphate reductase n=1 Tax=Prochlorococcus TaxID=1218 RepID=UPI0005338596|nr:MULTISPECIES: N-acetyl-gamma-glutamyl-phosphate reductase [Prochlorococcus]KGG12472.1 N-acetyl-gamma-glutamyl-phosphate reductase [Prochlorococcus sp. MIT 0601]